jgi:hypothetical protein
MQERDFMSIVTELKWTFTSTMPLYFVVGAGRLAVTKLRQIPADVRALPERAQDFTFIQVGKAAETYLVLAEHGKHLVHPDPLTAGNLGADLWGEDRRQLHEALAATATLATSAMAF